MWLHYSFAIIIYKVFIHGVLHVKEPKPGDMRFSFNGDTLYAESSNVSLMLYVRYLSDSLWFMLTAIYVSILAYVVNGAS